MPWFEAAAPRSLNTVKTVQEGSEKCGGTWSLWHTRTAQEAMGRGEIAGFRQETAEEGAKGPW